MLLPTASPLRLHSQLHSQLHSGETVATVGTRQLCCRDRGAPNLKKATPRPTASCCRSPGTAGQGVRSDGENRASCSVAPGRHFTILGRNKVPALCGDRMVGHSHQRGSGMPGDALMSYTSTTSVAESRRRSLQQLEEGPILTPHQVPSPEVRLKRTSSPC